MSTYETEVVCRAIISDRIREAERGRLARETKQSRDRRNSEPATASADRHSRVWKLVHLSHAYG